MGKNIWAYSRLISMLVVFVLVAQAGIAQTVRQDSTIRVGKLDNGLTYYIRHCEKDKDIAEFYIAQRVGSILEEPHQRGLAHFLEHMAFNGTEHFRGDSVSMGIVPWCESVGIRFGTNLNAYTSIDQTVYNICAAPVAREGVLDSCLLILRDWSCGLLLTGEEIDKERGVIHEEWRSRRSGRAVQRLMEQIAPRVYKGTKYEDCMPIGSMDVVDNFEYSALRDYYHRWYRPDLQGVVVVGDVDVDAVERKIISLFSPIVMPENPAERVYYPVSDNEEMIVARECDAEQPIILAHLYMKREATPDSVKITEQYQRDSYIEWMITYMLNQRISELQLQDNPPIISASVGSGAFFISQTKDAFSVSIGCKQEDVQGSVSSIIAETERARQHGFTDGEIERAKAKYNAAVERYYAERDTRHNSHYVGLCLNNFLDNEPMLDEEEELRLAMEFAQSVTAAEINAATAELISDNNQVLMIYAPEKEGVVVPSEEEFGAYVLEAQSKSYEPYNDGEIAESLMSELPDPGSIVAESDYGRHGFTHITLSNGIHVFVKPTDFNADQITLKLFAKGGTSHCPDSLAPNFGFVASAIADGGVGDYDVLKLDKMLAGKTLRVTPYVGHESQGIDASSSVKDLETTMQLMHLYFTAPRTDTIAFNSMLNRRRSLYQNREASPTVVYRDSTVAALYGDHPRTRPVKLETLDLVDYDAIRRIYAQCFSNASDFSLIVIGNVEIETLRPLLCRYIASLPVTRQPLADIADTYPSVVAGEQRHIFERQQATSTATVTIYRSAEVEVSAINDLRLDILSRVLTIAYTDSVREEKGGTYGVGVSFDLDPYSGPTAMLRISFRCDPERYEELVEIVDRQLQLVAERGPEASSLDKVKRYLVKQYAQNAITNDYWRYVIFGELYYGIDYDTGYTDAVEQVTAEEIRQVAAEILSQCHRIEVTMLSPKQ